MFPFLNFGFQFAGYCDLYIDKYSKNLRSYCSVHFSWIQTNLPKLSRKNRVSFFPPQFSRCLCFLFFYFMMQANSLRSKEKKIVQNVLVHLVFLPSHLIRLIPTTGQQFCLIRFSWNTICCFQLWEEVSWWQLFSPAYICLSKKWV